MQESTPIAVATEVVEDPSPVIASAQTPVAEETPIAEVPEPITKSIDPSEVEIEHKEVVPPPAAAVQSEAVPNVQVEVATPSSEITSFTSEDDGVDIDQDAPLEQRLAEAAGFAHAAGAVSEPLPDLEVAALETTRVTEMAEEELPTPTASADDLVESEEVKEAEVVDESTIFFTEPAAEPVEDATHVKKESVDLSTLTFTEPKEEDEVQPAEAETKTESEVSALSRHRT